MVSIGALLWAPPWAILVGSKFSFYWGCMVASIVSSRSSMVLASMVGSVRSSI